MKYLNFTAAFMAVISCMGFVSCSDDDENTTSGSDTVNPAQVFQAGIPKKVGDVNITCSSDGKVSSISDESQTASFRYLKPGEDGEFDVVMTIVESRAQDDETYTFKFKLNNQGFIEYALETYSDKSSDEWWFGYNSDGQLNYMKRSEGDNEVTQITYNGGNITSVSVKDDYNNADTTTITYGSSPKINKGAIMLFDLCFGIDMDEMDVAYYAGLLGKATKNLPEKVDYNDGFYTTFTWEINTAGMPSTMTYQDSDSYSEIIRFGW